MLHPDSLRLNVFLKNYMEITQGIRKMVIPLPHLPISPSSHPRVRCVSLQRLVTNERPLSSPTGLLVVHG
ncbi:MAG: hypothetical protein F6K31_06850 [Symploca sp. SIO2G7]|nr:hypothetical protein [Symploca sp. SIO2G7]